MSKRDDDIKAAAPNRLDTAGYQTGEWAGFIAGAEWADTNPAPEVLELIAALQFVIRRKGEDTDALLRCVDALVAYDKAQGGAK